MTSATSSRTVKDGSCSDVRFIPFDYPGGHWLGPCGHVVPRTWSRTSCTAHDECMFVRIRVPGPSGRAAQAKTRVCRPASVLYIPSWAIWTNWDPGYKRHMAPQSQNMLTVTDPHQSDSVQSSQTVTTRALGTPTRLRTVPGIPLLRVPF